MPDASCDIGLIGLAVMGQNLVLNMNDHGYKVAVFNRTCLLYTSCLSSSSTTPRSSAASAVAGCLLPSAAWASRPSKRA